MRPVVGPIGVRLKSRGPRQPEPTGLRPSEFRLALAQLPGRVREAIHLCRELTGVVAVASFRSAVLDSDGSLAMTPPMHPLCASRLHTVGAGPCEQEWQRHLHRSLRSRSLQSHVCPLDLRCSCIPIYYRDLLVGVAKCVGDGKTDSRQFSSAIRILDLAISKACQDFCVTVQSSELKTCRERIGRLQEIRSRKGAATKDPRPVPTKGSHAAGAGANGSLVERALEYIGQHYLQHEATLAAISRELKVSEKHMTSVFTRAVGQRMHAYIVRLRIQHACRMIVSTNKSIKQIAYESGFKQVDTFRRAFHRNVGVPPGAYRHAFGRG